VFVSNGQTFPLGIPLKATITPFEVTGGYRFRLTPRIAPYAGAGVGRYAYSETSTFNDAGEDVETSHVGFIVMGGVEVRAHRWIGIGVDAQFTRVTGILGTAGISKEFGDTDLGGTALRVKVLVGR
jgi:opacity protein-like surface antigen